MAGHATLRQEAEALSGPLPDLLAEAEHLAQSMMLGAHGRRQSGQGDEFWQYRPARAGDALRMVDWRRSAKSDAHFVREKEWQAAQAVLIWVDEAQSMDFASTDASELDFDIDTKDERHWKVRRWDGKELVPACGKVATFPMAIMPPGKKGDS